MPKPQEPVIGDEFIITHKKDGAANILTVQPVNLRALCEYKPVSIEVTDAQWDALRFHFATAVNDKEKISKLSYIY